MIDDAAEPDAGGGFTVLDGAALVVGAAVASVHIRAALRDDDQLDGAGWFLLWLTLAGVALTAAGPFVFLARRYGRRPRGYPRTGDWLWLALGVPWVAAATLRPDALADIVLGGGIMAASLLALGVVWRAWVATPPGRPRPKARPSWTERVGLLLAVGWPLQYGFLMVVGRS